MRMKKFTAKSLREGKALVIKELGNDAVILSSRTTRSAETGEEIVEIVAALDEANTRQQRPKLPASSFRFEQNHEETENVSSNENKINNEANAKIIEEISSLRDLVLRMADEVKYKHSGTMTAELSRLYKLFRNSEINEDFALEICGKIYKMGLAYDYEKALEESKNIITESMYFELPLQSSNKRNIVTFVGTTGSGKTSSLIKIAVVCKLLLKSNILIVSADTYKVGGAEQLQTFAAIAGISFQAVYSPEELTELLKTETKRDYIFIDTTGRSQNNKEHLDYIKEFIYAANADYNYLVLNAVSSELTTMKIIDNFEDMKITAAVLTKIDEAVSLGGIAGALKNKKMPLAYFSLGQQIPEDIEPANPDKFSELLFAEQM